MSERPHEWSTILVDALSKPGTILAAYTAFWNYSAGNQLLAMYQCCQRRIEPGPINTFRGWQELGRSVKKGEKALILCMPVRVQPKRERAVETESSSATEPAESPPPSTSARTIFIFKPRWFVLCQTEGKPYVPVALPQWIEDAALEKLAICRVPFTHLDGNCQGYAEHRNVAVSPLAALPHKTLFHELAHVLLGHTEDTPKMVDDERIVKSVREVEAESTALICCEALDLPGAEFCRGYIQSWLSGEKITDASAQRIFKAADAILKAGIPQPRLNTAT